jgi:transcriptional regulator with XRE-family HTH domain
MDIGPDREDREAAMASDQQKAAFAERLRIGRRAQGLNQQDLASALTNAGHPCTNKAVSAWESKRSVPEREVVAALDELLGLGDDLMSILGYAARSPIDVMAGSQPVSRDEFERRMADLEARMAHVEATTLTNREFATAADGPTGAPVVEQGPRRKRPAAGDTPEEPSGP